MDNIKEYFFHTININESIIEQLLICSNILNSGYIYNRKDLENKKVNVRMMTSVQNDDEVCLSLHPEGYKYYSAFIERDSKEPTIISKSIKLDDAFTQFVLEGISFVLNYKVYELGIDFNPTNSMTNEIRVKQSIPLNKYLLAISYPNKVALKLEHIKRMQSNPSTALMYSINTFDSIEQIYNEEIRNVELIKKLLQRHNLTIPVVDPISGIDIEKSLLDSYNLAKNEDFNLGKNK